MLNVKKKNSKPEFHASNNQCTVETFLECTGHSERKIEHWAPRNSWPIYR